MPPVYKTVAPAQLAQVQAQVDALETEVDNLPTGGGGSTTFPLATDLANGVGVGKLAKLSAAKAALADKTLGQAGQQAVATITISEAGTPAGTSDTPAYADFSISPMLTPGDTVSILSMFGNWVFGFYADPMMAPPGEIGVAIGPEAEATATNLANAINMNVPPTVASALESGDSIQVSAGTNYSGQAETMDLRLTTSNVMGVSIIGAGPMGELQNGSQNPVAGARITIVDSLSESAGTPSGDPLNTYIEAGVDWQPDPDLTINAQRIAQAITTVFKNNENKGWNATSAGPVVTVTRSIEGDVSDPLIPGFSFSGWGMSPVLNIVSLGTYPLPDVSSGPYLGKITAVAGGVATISGNLVDEFDAGEAIIAGQEVTGDTGGNVRVAGLNDTVLGVALTSAAQGAKVLVKQRV